MNRFSLLLLLTFGGMCLQAQVSSTITISTNPQGARFLVDGTLYSTTAVFNWPEGSEHTVAFLLDPVLPGQAATAVQTSIDGQTQYAFSGWVDNLGLLQPIGAPIQTITANPAITSLTANVVISFRIDLLLGSPANPAGSSPRQCPVPPGAPGTPGSAPGVVYIGGTCYASSGILFEPANSSVTLNAFPYPGYAFTGWTLASGSPYVYLTKFNLTGPTSITPHFAPAKLVSFLTSPLGLNLLIDDTTISTRTADDIPGCPTGEAQPQPVLLGFPAVCVGDLYFVPGSTHALSALTPQRDRTGNWWVFTGWSNGLGQDGAYHVPENISPVVLTADYVAGAQVSFVTSPNGLGLTVDGQSNLPSYNFIWGVGSTHQVTAAATQTGSNGRQYTFQGWSDGGSATQTYTVNQAAVTGGYRITATYSELDRLVVQSSPPGLTLQVDGAACVTPCNVDRASGATVKVTAPTQVPKGPDARLDFVAWSDGGASTHTVTIGQNSATLLADYSTYYALVASSNPSHGSAFKFSPASIDMFYAQGTPVTVTAEPNKGFNFGHWTGALSGSYPSGTVTMSSPQVVAAQMIAVPYIAPAGISNSVGQTPGSAVAPGSIISIFGQSMAASTEMGPVNPLSQSLGGVTVTVNDLILPLLFVSPEQINAQLPSSLTPGNYTLEIQPAGQTEISGTFTVARNAPGLFFQTVSSVNYATALHADGSPVTTASPAAAGETISLFGTGFGPYQHTVLDGFFPPNPPPAVEDSVTLSVGGTKTTSTSTAAPGFTGMDVTQFEVSSGLPGGTDVPVMVSINGEDSNTVMLPVK